MIYLIIENTSKILLVELFTISKYRISENIQLLKTDNGLY